MNLALSSLHGDWRITLEMTLKVPLRNQTVVFVLEIRDKLQARLYLYFPQQVSRTVQQYTTNNHTSLFRDIQGSFGYEIQNEFFVIR